MKDDEIIIPIEEYPSVIRQLRKKQKLSQTELGDKIGVYKSRISKIEIGSNITVDSLKELFKVLGYQIELNLIPINH